ncbi:hypothetical protein [Tepidimonas sp.]|uniref:hypothetical protein n=1 Tax=Tepidimonas sp. TaxID=2002775 RepID=UPI0028CD2C3A|nr:hypothetical protein [Tepidimonas sp.]MDT7928356.1 hypothetical protein [Tepidimonas sp.]
MRHWQASREAPRLWAQFAPASLGGMFWKGASHAGAMAGLLGGFGVWAYTLMLPSLAKSGWLPASFVTQGPGGIDWLRPEALLGLHGFDPLTHAMFWSLLVNLGLYLGVSLARPPGVGETGQAVLFVDVFERSASGGVGGRGAALADRRCAGHAARDRAPVSAVASVGGEVALARASDAGAARRQ